MFPITKTGKRAGETQSVIIDDLLLVSIINRLLCMLSRIDYMLQRSSHSFRIIFSSVRWNLAHSISVRMRPLRKVAGVQQLAYFDELGQAMLNSLFENQ